VNRYMESEPFEPASNLQERTDFRRDHECGSS
jgi:hypothetical protein